MYRGEIREVTRFKSNALVCHTVKHTHTHTQWTITDTIMTQCFPLTHTHIHTQTTLKPQEKDTHTLLFIEVAAHAFFNVNLKLREGNVHDRIILYLLQTGALQGEEVDERERERQMEPCNGCSKRMIFSAAAVDYRKALRAQYSSPICIPCS